MLLDAKRGEKLQETGYLLFVYSQKLHSEMKLYPLNI